MEEDGVEKLMGIGAVARHIRVCVTKNGHRFHMTGRQ